MTYMTKPATQTKNAETISKERLAFEKTRFDYVLRIYEEENKRKEILEKKSQFYLSFITLLLGAMFLNIDFIKILKIVITQKVNSLFQEWMVWAPLVVLSFSILTSLIGVFMALRLQSYKRPYPTKTISSLFAPDSRYFEDNTEASIFKVAAIDMTITLEINRNLNNKKTNWIKVVSTGIFTIILSFSMFLTAVIVLFVF